jgi:hypothetical protein
VGPLSKGWRADPDVNHEISDGPGNTHHVFRLTRRNIGVVNAADRSFFRHRKVGLNGVEGEPCGVLKAIRTEPLNELTAIIAVRDVDYRMGARNRQGRNLHA